MRLNQVTVPLIDYDASVEFYRTLGLRLIVDSPPHYARFECPQSDGGEPATFSIEKVEGEKVEGEKVGGWSGGSRATGSMIWSRS
jgi:catechol 2,3-dioxygenase-like lactoylglutathione lyase family enzyme